MSLLSGGAPPRLAELEQVTLYSHLHKILVNSTKKTIFAQNKQNMDSADFWTSVNGIIDDGFTPKGLQQLDYYAEQFISGRLIYQRFSPLEQHGCAAGGKTHVIASLLTAAKTGTNQTTQCDFADFKEELECAAQQAQVIEQWARCTGGTRQIKASFFCARLHEIL